MLSCQIALLVFLSVCIAKTGPESGLFAIVNADSSQVYITTSCAGSVNSVFYSSSDEGDILITPDSIKCASGIYTDTSFDRLFKFKEIQSISSTDIVYFFDLLFKKKTITAPDVSYGTVVPAGRNIYFYKTSANRYGAILKIGQSYGETDMAYYYIVRSESGFTTLYKNEPYPSLSSISVTASIFSDRPDPQFTIKEISSINSIFETLVNLRYSESDTAPVSGFDNETECNGIFIGTIKYCTLSSDDTCSILVGNHYIFYSDSRGSSKIIDPSNTIQNSIISAGRKDDLSYADDYGTLYFRDLFPECTPICDFNVNKDIASSNTTRRIITLKSRNFSVKIPVYTSKSAIRYSILTPQGRIVTGGFMELQKNAFTIDYLKPGMYMWSTGTGKNTTAFIVR
jgi:hypothetical protein